MELPPHSCLLLGDILRQWPAPAPPPQGAAAAARPAAQARSGVGGRVAVQECPKNAKALPAFAHVTHTHTYAQGSTRAIAAHRWNTRSCAFFWPIKLFASPSFWIDAFLQV